MDPKRFRGCKRLWLLDLDRTVLGPGEGLSQIMATSLASLLHDVHTVVGDRLGWISGTSTRGLWQWERLLGIAHRIMNIYVSEEGACTMAPKGWLAHEHSCGMSIKWHVQPRELAWERHCRKVAQLALQRKWQVGLSHPSTACALTTTMSPMAPMIWVDVTRLASFTSEVRVADVANRAVIDADRTAEAYEMIHAYFTHALGGEPYMEWAATEGWIDVPNPSASKGAAVRELRALVPEDTEIIVVENGKNGASCAGIDNVTLVAVANADQELLDVADHITKQPYTHGVIEYLSQVTGISP